MDYSLIIKPKAQQDIREAIEWYKEQSENLPQKLLNRIDECLGRIEQNPEYYQNDIKTSGLLLQKSFLTEFITQLKKILFLFMQFCTQNRTMKQLKSEGNKKIKIMNTELYKFFEDMPPAELAKLRGKRQDTSTRDKNTFLKKVSEIEEILSKENIEISLKKNK
ncbi:type II toxin-antitoxin system RelE/ParE family toxin [Elizabethkingia ursingii]